MPFLISTIDAAGEKNDVKVTQKLGYNRFMIDSVWKYGKIRLAADDVKKTGVDTYVRQERKLRTNRTVGNLMSKRKAVGDSVSKKEKNVPHPPWTLDTLCNGTVSSF